MLDKRDTTRDLYGIEQYVPGDPHSCKDLHVRTSSGTSGRGPSVVVDRNPLPVPRAEARHFMYPLRAGLIAFPNPTAALMNVRKALAEGTTERVMVLTSAELTLPDLDKHLQAFAPTGIKGITGLIGQVADHLHPTSLPSLETVIAEGEPIRTHHLRRHAALAPRARTISSYGMLELPNFSVSCAASLEHGDGTVYHLFEEQTTLSIAEPDAAGIGEIVASSEVLPAYRTGDLGRLSDGPCWCGWQEGRVLEFHGRKHFDVVSCAGALFLRSRVDAVFASLPEPVQDHLLEVTEEDDGESVRGRVTAYVVPARTCSHATLQETVAQHLCTHLQVTKTRTLGQLVAADLFLSPQVHVTTEVPRGTTKHITLRKR